MSLFLCLLDTGATHLTVILKVTQIPLEAPPQDVPSTKPRPPWIRPARKKTLRSSASTESTSQHGSPEGFSPSENFLDISGASALGSPQPPSAAFSPTTNGTNHGFALSGTPGPLPPQSFGDNSMDISNTPQTMNPADLLAMFGGESNIDIASLLMSPELSGQNLSESQHYFGSSLAGTSPSGMVSS